MRKITLFALILPLLSGCFGTSETSRFYTLVPQTIDVPVVRAARPISIGVEPVIIPGYLDRPQIVVRSKDFPGEVKLSEFERWAEELRDALPRLIAQNIRTYASNVQIGVVRSTNRSFDYSFSVSLIQFDAVLGEKAFLEATYLIYGKGGAVLKQGSVKESLSVDSSYPSVVKQESRLIAKLSNELVTEIIALDRKR